MRAVIPRLLRPIPWVYRKDDLLSRLSYTLKPYGTVSAALHDGRRLRIWSGGDPLSSLLFWRGFAAFEPAALPVFARLAATADVIMDIGANMGVYSLVAAATNPRARIFAFEPVPLVFRRLTRNIELNHGERVVCVRAAVGDRDGRTPIYQRPNRVESDASTDPRHRMTWTEGPWCCDLVPSIPIDTFVIEAGVPTVDLVKIDVEKAEVAVLTGMAPYRGQQRVLRRSLVTMGTTTIS